MIMSDQKTVPEQLREFATQEKANELLYILNLKNSLHEQRLLVFLMSSKEKKSDEKKESLIKNGFWRNPLYDKNVLKIVNGFMTSEKPGICFCLPRFAVVKPIKLNSYAEHKRLAEYKEIKILVLYDDGAIIDNFHMALYFNGYEYKSYNGVDAFNKDIDGVNFIICSSESNMNHDSVETIYKHPATKDFYRTANIILFLGKSEKVGKWIKDTININNTKLLRLYFTQLQTIQLKHISFYYSYKEIFINKLRLDVIPHTREKVLLDQLMIQLHSAIISPEKLQRAIEYEPEPLPQRSSRCVMM